MERLCKVFSIIALLGPTASHAYDEAAIVEHCEAKWGSDFSMIKYCRDQQRSAGQAYDQFKIQAETNETAAEILARCEGKWLKDYSMVTYCIQQQSSALRSLAAPEKDVPAKVRKQIKTQCSAKWGTDFSMVAYCVEQQTDAWRSLQ